MTSNLEEMHLGGAACKTSFLKKINDGIEFEQVYMRVPWKDKKYD